MKDGAGWSRRKPTSPGRLGRPRHSNSRFGNFAQAHRPKRADAGTKSDQHRLFYGGAALKRELLLDSYYIPTRYPNGLPDDIPARVYNRQAAERALALAQAVATEVEAWFAEMPESGHWQIRDSGPDQPRIGNGD